MYSPLPYLVLDQSALRRPSILHPALAQAEREGLQLLVPDVAILEMMKNAQWEAAARNSLRSLFPVRHLVVLGRCVADLIRDELRTGIPALNRIVDKERTPSLIRLIVDLNTDPDGDALRYARSHIQNAHERTLPAYLDHADNHRMMVRFRDGWRKLLEPNFKPQDCAPLETRVALLADPFWGKMLCDDLTSLDVHPKTAQSLSFGRSVTSHSFLTAVSMSLRWYIDHGLDRASPTKITNDLLDGDYVTIASFCANLVTEETRLRQRLDEVRSAAQVRHLAAPRVYPSTP